MVTVLNRELPSNANPEVQEAFRACQQFVEDADDLIEGGGDVWGVDGTSVANLRSFVNSLGLFLHSSISGEMRSAHIPTGLLADLAKILPKAAISQRERTPNQIRDSISIIRRQLFHWIGQVGIGVEDPRGERSVAWNNFIENTEHYLAPDYQNYMKSVNASLNNAQAEVSRLQAKINEHESAIIRDKERQAAGNTGASKLAEHFDALSKVEAESEANYMKLFVGCLLVITGIGVWILATAHDSEWKTIAIRAGLSLPVVAATTYVAKIAGRHREAKFWTRTAAVQLKTIGAYTSAIDDEKLRGSIYSTLGQSVFANPELASKADGQANFLPLDVIELVKLVTERAKTSA